MNIAIDNKVEEIANKTMGELQSFLSEIVYGTKNYKSLYNLTEQMTHDYANRFIIEMLQNAYDAISKSDTYKTQGTPGKIKIILDEREGQPSVLYFANTGKAMTSSNFRSLSSLALSDKSPSDSVGNKGIGFKSVLQVCRTPQVYSGSWEDKLGFSGYCFGFFPKKRELLAKKIDQMIHTRNTPDFSDIFGIPIALKDWHKEKIVELERVTKQFTQDTGSREANFFYSEIQHISPYTIPFPLSGGAEDPFLKQLGRENYVTVIKLELNQEQALFLTKEAIKELNDKSWMFLEAISEIHIQHYGNLEEDLTRSMYKNNVVLIDRLTQLSEVSIGEESRKIYWVWTTTIGGDVQPEKQLAIQEAARQLPGSWSDFNKARIQIAIPKGEKREDGLVFIYLPTKQSTGLSMHVNAPFYGQMNRKSIDCSVRINAFLLEEMAELIFQAVCDVLSRQPDESGDMIIDLLSFKNNLSERPGEIIVKRFEDILSNKAIKLADWDIIPYRDFNGIKAFGKISQVYRLPDDWEFKIFSKHNLSSKLKIKILSDVSKDRLATMDSLANYCNYYMFPSDKDRANWAESMAIFLHKQNCDMSSWQNYYDELITLVKNPSYLLKKSILIGHDDQLHVSGDEANTSWFFLSPVHSNEADSNLTNLSSFRQVPAFLNNKISYFHHAIRLYNTQDGRRTKSKLLDYLREGSPSLVEEFSIEALLDKVILPEMPVQLVEYDTQKSEELFKILEWSLSLFFGARSEPSSYREKFMRLWLPCRAGWKKATDIYFSKMWDQTGSVRYGSMLSRFFVASGYKDGVNKELLDFMIFPESIRQFGIERLTQFFMFCGVVDHLRLIPALPSRRIRMRGFQRRYYFVAPDQGYFNDNQMDYWKTAFENARSEYFGEFDYEVRNVDNIDGIRDYKSFNDETKLLFAQLIAYSISKWDGDWQTLRIVKLSGNHGVTYVPSLVAVTLKNLPWIPLGRERENSYGSLNEAWFVPSVHQSISAHRYSFIPYITYSVAQIIEVENSLIKLIQYGLSRFEIYSLREGYKLLNFLERQFTEGKVPFDMMNYLKGHYKKTWDSVLRLIREGANVEEQAPQKLLCMKGKEIESVDLNHPDEQVYIPDNKKLTIHLYQNPLVNILLIDNRADYSGYLHTIYNGRLRVLSGLSQVVRIDEKIWTNADSSLIEAKLVQEDRAWLLTFIMSVVTFREDSQIYLSSNRFNELLSELHRAKIVFCKNIEILMESEEGICFSRKKVNIHTSKDFETFFISKEDFSNWDEFATALGEYLEIMPLEWPLKYAFSKMRFDLNDMTPERRSIIETLRMINITEENFEAIERTLNDDVQWCIDRLVPVLHMYKVFDSLHLDRIKNESTGKELLSEILPHGINVDQLWKLAKESTSDYKMGYALFEHFGISLSEWNVAISKSSPSRHTIENANLVHDFQSLKDRYKDTIISVFRNEVRAERLSMEDYVQKKNEFQAWTMPEMWKMQYWTINEQLFRATLIDHLRTNHVDDSILEAIRDTESLAQMVALISKTIKDVHLSTYEIVKANYKLIRDCIKQVLSAYISYFQKSNAEIPRYLLTTEQVIYQHLIESGIEGQFELNIWDERNAYSYVINSKGFGTFIDSLPETVKSVQSLEELLAILQLQPSDLELAAEKIQAIKEEMLRVRRTVKILGQDFDTDENNLHTMSELLGAVEFTNENINGTIDSPISLKGVIPSNHGSIHGGFQGRTTKTQRGNKQTESAIGLAGEILAYRYLKEQYPEVCNPDSWKSENSLYNFPGKVVNDQLGYDFELRIDKKTYHIEVKTTVGSDPHFELGSSEQRKAIEDATRRHTEFVILFVVQVFDHPRFYWLPNPYSTKGKDLYTIRETGARVSFRM